MECQAGFYIIDVDDTTVGSRYRITTNNDPGRVVLSTSAEKFSGALFGFRRSVLAPGPGVAGGTIQPATPPNSTPTTPGTPVVVPDVPAIKLPDVPMTNEPEKPSSPLIPDKVEIDEGEEPVLPEESPEEGFFTLDRVVNFGVAPLALALAAANFIAGISAGATLFPYLQYLLQIFTEPFRYWGTKKPKGFGLVYNVLTNEPVDLAIVRLYDKRDWSIKRIDCNRFKR